MSERPRPGKGSDAGPSSGGGGALSGSEFAGLGLQFAVSILVFLYAGRWLDDRLGTAPWLLLAGVFVGAGASFYVMYRKVIAAQKRDAERRKG